MFQGVIDFLQNAVAWLLALMKACLTTILTMLEDLIAWVIDQLLSLVVAICQQFNVTIPAEFISAINALPPEIMNTFHLLGIPHALAIVTAALGIRFILGLIPIVNVGR